MGSRGVEARGFAGLRDRHGPARFQRPHIGRAPLIMNSPSSESATASVFGAPRSAATATQAPPRASGPQPARVGGDDIVKTVRREEPKVGRNEPCPCGSGKKYKKCHGAAA